jgi:hypothetical protein
MINQLPSFSMVCILLLPASRSACNSTVLLSQQIHSDSDIHLDATGSFKRFDPVDHDFRVTITTSSLMGSSGGSPPPTASIPPQPLRPAPAPAPLRPAPPPPPDNNNRPPETTGSLLQGVATVTTAIVPADDPESGEQLPPTLQRAMSCDSVCSDTSVVLGDLEEPNVTGYLCVGLEYDRWGWQASVVPFAGNIGSFAGNIGPFAGNIVQ